MPRFEHLVDQIVRPLLNASVFTIERLVWSTKALYQRGYHPMASDLLAQLCLILNESYPANLELKAAAAAGFSTIMDPNALDLLTDAADANTQMMYRQRLFTTCIPILRTGFEQASLAFKPAFLVAITHILRHVSTSVLLSALSSLLPIILHTLSQHDNNTAMLSSTLSTIVLIVNQAPKFILDHINSFVTPLLALTQYPFSFRVRETALYLILRFAQLDFVALFPFKERVIQSLLPCLDDHKRIVRRAAIQCRNQWSLL